MMNQRSSGTGGNHIPYRCRNRVSLRLFTLNAKRPQNLCQPVLVHPPLGDRNHRVVEPPLWVEDGNPVQIPEEECRDQPRTFVAI